MDGDLPNAEALDGDRIDGVKVLWITETRAARDETAFRHALATAHQLREAGKKMTDAAIIDAYERAYTIAQAVGRITGSRRCHLCGIVSRWPDASAATAWNMESKMSGLTQAAQLDEKVPGLFIKVRNLRRSICRKGGH
ncbi:MAG: hypothetical protein E7L40_01155 [Corynebacterium kroppenstedtii]|uniref:hypothetical protein n=1 Tax=Corynebacterium kroppenstedtii TaxID=161879 RepID=UPI0026F24C49|nr:hypothetical protein [Corynebacterium kroppenstedtii]MDU7286228.1 hypothetical protein [Corynebacterium kroppenstedtii]